MRERVSGPKLWPRATARERELSDKSEERVSSLHEVDKTLIARASCFYPFSILHTGDTGMHNIFEAILITTKPG